MAANANPNDTQGKPETVPLHELSDAELSKFELDGTLPTREAKPASENKDGDEAEQGAEAAADKPVDQAASNPDAKAKAAPESADLGKKTQKQPGQKKNASERAAEIEREAVEAEQRLEAALTRRRRAQDAVKALEREDPSDKAAKPGESAAPATGDSADVLKKYTTHEKAPKPPSIDDPKFKNVDEYLVAEREYSVRMAHFIADQIAEEKFGTLYDSRAKQDRQSYEDDQAFLAQVEEAEARVSKELAEDPGLIDRIDERFRALNPSSRRRADEPMTVAHFIKDQVTFNSKHTLKLSEWLTKDGNKELRRIGQLRPEQIIREIAVQDREFDAAYSDEDESQDTGAGERPQHSRVSKAPTPAPTLGKKAAAGKDPTKAAIEAGDFDTFNELETKREIASGGKRR